MNTDLFSMTEEEFYNSEFVDWSMRINLFLCKSGLSTSAVATFLEEFGEFMKNDLDDSVDNLKDAGWQIVSRLRGY